MKVSILIPLYNGIEFLNECLHSVHTQTHTDWEVIIGVNGHTQESGVFQQAKSYESPQIKVSLYPTIGKPNTLNQMIHDASADIICLLDVDDFWEPRKLEEQLKLIDTYDVVGTHTIYVKQGKRTIQPKIPVGVVKEFLSVNPMINSSLMLHKPDCHWNDVVLDDYDLVLRLASEGKSFYNIPLPLTLHRLHSQSFFNSKGNNNHVEETKQKWKTLIQARRLE